MNQCEYDELLFLSLYVFKVQHDYVGFNKVFFYKKMDLFTNYNYIKFYFIDLYTIFRFFTVIFTDN